MQPHAPTLRQLIGLGITLAAVALFSLYTQRQITGLRRIATETLERNRRDTLQLVRVQNDLNQLALLLRDMAEGAEPYPLPGYRPSLDRLRGDLSDALENEARLTPANRTEAQQAMLKDVYERFWREADQVWVLAAQGKEDEARQLIRTRLEASRSTMSSIVSRLLILNSEAEAAGFREVAGIYDRVERNVYLMFAAVLFAIVVTGFLVIQFNRRIFSELAAVSEQRRELAVRVISVQEDVFQTLAREMHDDLGQALTALGIMLQRIEKRYAGDDKARQDVREVREIADQTLDRVRSMSQMLHPPVLDDYGLARSIEWYIGQFTRQTGLKVRHESAGEVPWIGDRIAIHVYRILQEALNNAAKHARGAEVQVKTLYQPGYLELTVADNGQGMPEKLPERGFGLIAMRERAELLHGTIVIERALGGGTQVRLRVPLTQAPES